MSKLNLGKGSILTILGMVLAGGGTVLSTMADNTKRQEDIQREVELQLNNRMNEKAE